MTVTDTTRNVPQSVSEAIEGRRSIRHFVQQPIPEADLREMVRLASLAPSAWNAQTWRFVIVTNKDVQAKMQEAAYGQQQVSNAPAVIVVYSDMEDTLSTIEQTVHPGMGEEAVGKQRATFDGNFGSLEVAQRGQWGLTQANIAFGYLTLAARGMGYDASPMGGFNHDKMREILGLPEHALFAGIMPVGLAATEGHPHHRHSVERITKFI